MSGPAPGSPSKCTTTLKADLPAAWSGPHTWEKQALAPCHPEVGPSGYLGVRREARGLSPARPPRHWAGLLNIALTLNAPPPLCWLPLGASQPPTSHAPEDRPVGRNAGLPGLWPQMTVLASYRSCW